MDKSFDKSVKFHDFELGIIILLVTVQLITVFSNTIVIIVMKRSHIRQDAMSFSKRTNILMTTIAISGLILIADFSLAFFMIIPIVKPFSQIVSLAIDSIVNYIIVLSLYVKSFTMALISIDQYYSLTRVFKNPLDKISTNLQIKIIWLASSVLYSYNHAMDGPPGPNSEPGSNSFMSFPGMN